MFFGSQDEREFPNGGPFPGSGSLARGGATGTLLWRSTGIQSEPYEGPLDVCQQLHDQALLVACRLNG